MELNQILIVGAVFVVALLYSSVGHGGASGYLAVMALFAVSPAVTRPTALILNVFVASIAFVQFYRAKSFDWRIFLPFAVASVPMAYFGGRVQLAEPVYKIILGVCLVIAAIRLSIKLTSESEPKSPSILIALIIGSVLGFVSGLVGVGGGIFLTPVLLLMNWTDTKTAAGVSALFIVANSASALAGGARELSQLSGAFFVWIIAAVIGGIIGSTLGSSRFDSLTMRRVLAAVLVVAGVKLFFV
jgi:uncharacterized membrane protein YfcA